MEINCIRDKNMVYSKLHTIDHCDRCLKLVGVDNLFTVPFQYCDKNDKCKHHYVNTSKKYVVYVINDKPIVFEVDAYPYKQYKVCKLCFDIEYKIWSR